MQTPVDVAHPSRAALSKARIDRWFVAGIVALAFGLRVFRLGTQSLWGDEAFSVFRAFDSLVEITEAVPREGTLPPLYYYLLHFWVPVAGTSETGVRFLSLLFGVLAVPLLYVLVRRTLGLATAIVAAIIAALSPFWIYYAQETRTYAQVTALLVLALYLLVRAGTDTDWQGSGWAWAGYSVAAALALYSYYFAGFALAAATLWLLAEYRQSPGVVLRCVLAQIGALALIAPLLIYSFSALVGLANSPDKGGLSVATILDHLTRVFNFGTSIDPNPARPFVILALAIGALGFLTMPRRFASLWGALLVVPVGCILVVSFVPHNGWERYFMTATPAWYALVASGITGLAGAGRASSVAKAEQSSWPRPENVSPAPKLVVVGRVGAGLASAGMLVGIVTSLHNYYFDPAYWRYDFRSAVHQVETPATPDVAVVVNGQIGYPSFFYYFRKTIPWVELPAPGTTSRQTDATLTSLAERYRGIWLVTRHPEDDDPTRVVQVWLDENAYAERTWWVENATFTFYLTRDPVAPRIVAAFPVNRTIGGDAELLNYRADVVRSQDVDYLLVTLTWRALRTPTEDLRVFAHLADSSDDRLAQFDHRPANEVRPARTWQPGDVIVDRFALKLPEHYVGRGLRLETGLFTPQHGRLPIQGADPPSDTLVLPLAGLNPLPAYTPLLRHLGPGIAFLGYALPRSQAQPGDTLRLTLYWQRQGPIGGDETVFAHLLAPGPRVVAQVDSRPLGGLRPTTTWLLNEVLADTYDIVIPRDTAAGAYQIEVGMYDPRTGKRLPVQRDGKIEPDDRILLPDSIQVGPRG